MPPESRPPASQLAFTKLVVHDLEGLVGFYAEVYGLHAVHRVRGEGIGGERIDEVMMSSDPDATWSSPVLLAYVDRLAPASDEVILGFTTDDLPGLLECVRLVASGPAARAGTQPSARPRPSRAA